MLDETMGNQPQSLDSIKGWLGGIIDGEGCLQLARQRYKNRYHYRPQIVIGNNNLIIIEKIRESASRIGLPVYFLDRGYTAKNSRAKTVVMQIMGLKRSKQWLLELAPFIHGKREQATIILEYIEYRLSQPNPSAGVITFGEKDEEFRKRLDVANHRYRI